jgi:uncharacterized protein YndB with AHSA1/START domain
MVPSRRVKRERLVDARVEEVWEALTDPALLSEWLGDEVELDAFEGGELSVRVGGDERRGTVQRVDAERGLAFTWERPGEAATTVELTLEPAVAGTRVTVVERASAPGPVALSGAVWEMRLGGLARVLSLALV